MKTKVVHCQKEPYDIYIGRPSMWGNPYSHRQDTKAKEIVATRAEAVAKYKEYARNNPKIMKSLDTLKGKVLGCWCSPALCHGDALIELIEECT